MEEKKIVVEEKPETVETTETKPKFGDKVKAFFKRHKGKFIVAGLGAAGVAAGALVKSHRDKVKEREEAEEAEKDRLAEEWYNKGLAAQAALPETTESTESTTEDEY